jgi:hypothetical protein
MSRPRLTSIDVIRAALLRCRYAGRFDTLTDPDRARATAGEATEEARAAHTRGVPTTIYLETTRLGLTEHMPGRGHRLTAAGAAWLAERR